MDPLALLKQIDDSPGARLQNSLRALRATRLTLKMNAQELNESLEEFNRPPIVFALWSVDNRELLHNYYCEVIRLFHNYLASTKSLVDHTRSFIQRTYAQEAFAAVYEAKVKEVFAASGLVAFVHGLRNYMLHKGQPPTRARLSSSGPGDVRSAIYLDLDSLRNWDGWTPRARAHLGTFASDPNLLDVVDAYETVADSFYEWLDGRIKELHALDFAELDKLQAELARLLVARGDKRGA